MGGVIVVIDVCVCLMMTIIVLIIVMMKPADKWDVGVDLLITKVVFYIVLHL